MFKNSYYTFFISLGFILIIISCSNQKRVLKNPLGIKNQIHKNLNAWHNAAARADFDSYFNLMTDDGVFIGTDAAENWQNTAFKTFSKPYFDKGKAWSFTPLERHIYLNDTQDIAWFDELLNTQMELCRGSGVVIKRDAEWKIAHYVLSMAIPNANSKEIIEAKKVWDSTYKATHAKKFKMFTTKNNK